MTRDSLGYKDKSERKKQWQKPRLMILTRDKPGEAILTACKVAAIPESPSPGTHLYACEQPSYFICYGCYQRDGS